MAPVPESKGVKWVPYEQHGVGTIAESTSQVHEIHEFIKGNVDKLGVKKETSVEKLRRIIPILIMDNFNVREEPCQKKVKGIWNEKPQGWPDEIPFCDPNNTIKGGNGKPKKKLLIQMCNFLVNKFLKANNYQVVEDIKPSLELLYPHTLPNKSEQTSLDAPSEVSAEEEESLDPAVENLGRLRKKLNHLANKAYLSDDDTKLYAQILDKLCLVTVKRCEEFLQICHELEVTFDLAIYEKKMSNSHREKWQNLKIAPEENIETSVVADPLEETFWQDLGIQGIEQITWDELQSNGRLDVRPVSNNEEETTDYNTKEMTEDEKAAAKLQQLQQLQPDTSPGCMSLQKADVPTVLEVPYGNQSDANWPTSYPFDNGLDQQQAENQHMRSLLMDRTGNDFTEQGLPENGFDCEWNESDIAKMVMEIQETSERAEERPTVENQVLVYQYNGGDGMDMEVDIPLPTSLTVKEIFDTGPLA